MTTRLLFMTLILTLAAKAHATILDETRTDDVNQSSVHIKCQLQDMDLAEFAAHTKIVIHTEFGDDAPNAEVYGTDKKLDANITMTDFSDHPHLNMRIFVLLNMETDQITNLIVVYSKQNGRIQATGVLTTNGQPNPVVNARDMKCEYVGPMAING
ncbi:MAG: hypothetical protein AB7N80_07360 [Bdellovibrionales bacterium]